MSKRSNRLPVTLANAKAENADNLIRTGSADFIMAHNDAEYMTAFAPIAQRKTLTRAGLYMRFDRVFVVAVKGFDPEILLDPLEKKLHLPAQAVQFGDSQGG